MLTASLSKINAGLVHTGVHVFFNLVMTSMGHFLLMLEQAVWWLRSFGMWHFFGHVVPTFSKTVVPSSLKVWAVHFHSLWIAQPLKMRAPQSFKMLLSLQSETYSHFRRHETSATVLWEPQMLQIVWCVEAGSLYTTATVAKPFFLT